MRYICFRVIATILIELFEMQCANLYVISDLQCLHLKTKNQKAIVPPINAVVLWIATTMTSGEKKKLIHVK